MLWFFLSGCLLLMERPLVCEQETCPGHFLCKWGACATSCATDYDCEDGFYCNSDGTCGEPCDGEPCSGHYTCWEEINQCRDSCFLPEDCEEGYVCCTHSWEDDCDYGTCMPE